MKGLNFIDLFAGASGLAEGFIKAGFNPLAHIEVDRDACQTIKTRLAYHYLRENSKLSIYESYLEGRIDREQLYQYVPAKIINSVLNEEIRDDSIEVLFARIDQILDGREVDIIIGGPPCQAYSVIGRHKVDIDNDPRSSLYIQYGKFLKKYKPKAFVFENVPGLLNVRKGKLFKELEKCFKDCEYNLYYDTLEAADYGVMQRRKRIILVGWRRDNDYGYPGIEKIERNYTVKDLFSDLPKIRSGVNMPQAEYTAKGSEYLERFGIRNGNFFVTQHIARPHNIRDLKIYELAISKWKNERIRLKYPDIPEELRTHNNTTSFLDRFKVVDEDSISHTVIAHIAKDGHYYIHPDIEQCRSLSIREAARLQSFPDDFYFEGSRSAAFRQIGNAVPPLMAYAIANKMRELICQIE